MRFVHAFALIAFASAPFAAMAACNPTDSGAATDSLGTYQTLSVHFAGTGKGTVTLDPPDRDKKSSASSDTDFTYPTNAGVKLTPKAADGSSFTGWATGSDPSCGASQLLIGSAAATCIAQFDTGASGPDGGSGTTDNDAGSDAGSGGTKSPIIALADTMNRFQPITLDTYTCSTGSQGVLLAALPATFAGAVSLSGNFGLALTDDSAANVRIGTLTADGKELSEIMWEGTAPGGKFSFFSGDSGQVQSTTAKPAGGGATGDLIVAGNYKCK